MDIVKIDEYAYYINTLDDAYKVWQGHPLAQFAFKPPDDFSPLKPHPNQNDLPSHQAACENPLIFSFCHFWRNEIEFTYVDVGANIGSTIIIMAGFIRRMGRRNKCVAFEPGVAGSLLGYSVELNGLSDIVTVNRRAADAKTGTTLFHSMLGHSASNSALDIHSSFDIPLARSTVVRTVRLDEVVSGPVIAKIDTEGNDFRVVKGMERVIAGHDTCLQLEFNPSYVARIADPLEEMRRLDSDFQLYIVDPDKPWNAIEKAEASPECIERIRSSPRGWVDLFAIQRRMKSFKQFTSEFESKFVKGA